MNHRTVGTRSRRWLAAHVRRAAAHTTRHIAQRYAEPLDIWIGCGYPKSGTMWLCRLLSNYLDAPLPQNSLLPIAMRSVIHAHWMPYSPRHKVAYILRDGRDVMISMYFHQLQILKRNTNPRSAHIVRRRFEEIAGPNGDYEDLPSNLPAFIRMEAERPHASRINWGDHVNGWLRVSDASVAHVRYESLLKNPRLSLEFVLESLGEVPNEEFVNLAVTRHDFAQSQRLTRVDTSLKRRGAAGDWQRYFTLEAAEVFDSYFGDALLSCGYESDRSWIARVESPDGRT